MKRADLRVNNVRFADLLTYAAGHPAGENCRYIEAAVADVLLVAIFRQGGASGWGRR